MRAVEINPGDTVVPLHLDARTLSFRHVILQSICCFQIFVFSS
jgi:hypothetical protein